MKKGFVLGAALTLSASMATAGGLDRSGQSINAIFEDGNYVELSFGYVMPSVTGELGGGALLSGQVVPNYTSLGLAFTQQVNEKLSFGLIFDQPFGAHIDYVDAAAGGWPLGIAAAELRSSSLTALGRYRFNESVSVHGGVRLISMEGTINAGGTIIEYDSSTDVAFVVGAAYEIPAIALRAALTYSSATEFTNTGYVGGFPATLIPDYTMPQSVNLDFQTGIAANTLLMASVRWTDWTETALITPLGLIDYDQDVYTYSIGVGRKFSEAFSGSISIGYEKSQGGAASNLSPTDGYLSLSIGGAYTLDNGMKISGGVRYVQIGDATTEIIGGDFADNSAIAVGMKISTSF